MTDNQTPGDWLLTMADIIEQWQTNPSFSESSVASRLERLKNEMRDLVGVLDEAQGLTGDAAPRTLQGRLDAMEAAKGKK
jgi:hypothetical protein